MTDILAAPLIFFLKLFYSLTQSYVLAIILFTALTKIILFPISLWMHSNSLRMVALMPELNRLTIRYYGDKDTIAEETQKLYKERKYHPLASIVPMVLQLVLLLGVIGAVEQLLEGTDSLLAVYPSQQGGITLLMPIAAGLAALALGLSQSRYNPLQREQSLAGQWSTNGISIAISLVLGAFVPVGVGFYWIASNLFSILQQFILNAVMPPKRHVDYKDLEASKKELAEINKLSSNITKEDKQREKADYKRFFSVANKHLVFYSESSGFYKYYKSLIENLLSHSNIIIHYITSDPKDQVFRIAQEQPRIRPYYIGEKRLITLMMKMDADIVVMTMPDLENYHIKRSYVRNDIEYVYMHHGIFSGIETLRKGALDHYDTILLSTPGDEVELRGYNKKYGLPDQKMIPFGYGIVDDMAAEYDHMDKTEREIKKILIAPSWQKDNILESCLKDLAEPLLNAGYDITVRPHPQYIRRFPQRLQAIVTSCELYDKDSFRFQMDFSSNDTVYTADSIITDWSGISYEYSLATKKPAIHINTPKKRVNEEWTDEDIKKYGFDSDIRNIIGVSLEIAEVRSKIVETVENLLKNQSDWDKKIEKVRQERIYHFGESGLYGAKYILGQLKERKNKQ